MQAASVLQASANETARERFLQFMKKITFYN